MLTGEKYLLTDNKRAQNTPQTKGNTIQVNHLSSSSLPLTFRALCTLGTGPVHSCVWVSLTADSHCPRAISTETCHF